LITFKNLGVIEPITRALEELGYNQPTPIQEKSIPILLEHQDLLGCAQTGTGKTAAFAIPILQHIQDTPIPKGRRPIQALVVSPTRELAIQIADSFTDYGKYLSVKNTVIFGGVKQGNQTSALSKGVDVLVATPGRLLDLMDQGYISLNAIEYFVLDEADRMLDMGFIHDIKRIIAQLPKRRQSLFFSATMLPDIVALSNKILGNPKKITIQPEQTTAERVDQALYFVAKKDKPKLLIHILQTQPSFTVLVFSRTKHGADKIVKILRKADITADAIHGNKSQGARQRALNLFKAGKTHVLVATDIAARGIDVEELSLVVNYDLPNIPETYIHRIGRTGRAQSSGIALSFCNVEEREYLRDIEKLIDQKIDVVDDHPFVDQEEVPATKSKPANQQGQSRHRPNRSGSGNKKHNSQRRWNNKSRKG